MLRRKYNSWKKSYQRRRIYCTMDRRPFYDIAAKYLLSDENGIVVDIGSGVGEFADYLNLASTYKNVFLLDGNSATIENLKSRFRNAILYKCPNKLPFESATVNFIHCSHLIGYLYPQDFYQFLKEIDRVLVKNGIFVVSAPMLWSRFYNNLAHVKPYNHEVLLNYLCCKSKNPSHDIISDKYLVLELVYRYRTLAFYESWGSGLSVIDFVIRLLMKVISILGIKKYAINGYTLVLKKE